MKWTMQAISSEALPLAATPKGVTKWAFIYVKRAKNSVIYIGTSRNESYVRISTAAENGLIYSDSD